MGVVANAAAAKDLQLGRANAVRPHTARGWRQTISITCGSRIDDVEKPKTRADNASTMNAPGSVSSVIDAPGSYPAYQNARQLSDMLFTAGA
jgi:hypothetical protein